MTITLNQYLETLYQDFTRSEFDSVISNTQKEITEHDHCLRCGRKLKNPEARLLGYGSV